MLFARLRRSSGLQHGLSCPFCVSFWLGLVFSPIMSPFWTPPEHTLFYFVFYWIVYSLGTAGLAMAMLLFFGVGGAGDEEEGPG